jgi:multidrug resistance protein, MATE family
MTSDPEVVAVATPLLRIAGVFQIFDGAQAVASGALRGAGSTRWAFAANMVAYWAVALPVGLVGAFVLKAGPAGLWWGLTAGLCVSALALSGRFLRLSSRPIAAL